MQNKAASPVSERISTITKQPIYARCIFVTEQSNSTATSELVETSAAPAPAPFPPVAEAAGAGFAVAAIVTGAKDYQLPPAPAALSVFVVVVLEAW